MDWQTILYFSSILLTCLLTGFLTWYAWRQPHVTGARSYAYMALAESLLALTEIGVMLAGTEPQAAFWFSLRVPFAAIIPVFWLFFALEYSGRGDWLSKLLRVALFAIPVITQAVMVTGSLHGLWLVRDVAFEKIGPFWIADTSARIPSLWYLVHTFYSTLLLVVGAGVLVVAAWRKTKRLLGQALLVSLGALTALGLALTGVFNLLPELRFNPFVPGIGFSAVCYALAIFRFQFLKHPLPAESGARLTDLKPEEKGSLAVLVLIFILFVSGITASGYLTYQNYERQFRAQVDSQLESIASLKADELQNWRAERLADANLFHRNKNFSERVRAYFENPQDAEAQARLLNWMEKITDSREYDRIFLLDAQGLERIAIPAAPESIPPDLMTQAFISLETDQVIFLDFHLHPDDDAVYLSMLVPIFDAQNDQPLATLILRIDPNVYLYPFFQLWPVPSESAETLLLRREGQEIVYLNALRFQSDAALELGFPLSETEIPAVKVALGETGIVEGVDYRGVKVVADIRPVPGTPWFLVSKMDTAEVYASLWERLWQTVFFFGALILATAVGLLLIWRQQQVYHFRTQIEMLGALKASEEKFRLAFETSPDSVAITRAKDGMFVSVNKGFEQISGYKREEVVGKTSLEVNIWKNPADRQRVVEELRANGEVRDFESVFLRREGEIVGLMSAAIIELNGEPHILNIVRDITERKQAADALHASKANLSALIENTDGSIWAVDRQYGLIVGNEEFHRNVSAALGRHLEDGESALPPNFPAEAISEWQGYYDRSLQGERFSIETLTRFRSNPHYIEYRFSPIRGDDEEIRGVTVYGRDITERKQAEEALHQLNDRLALAQRLAGAGIWDWDLATGKLNWTPEFFSLFGLDPATSDATFDTWRGALHPDDIQGAEQRINEAIRDHVPLFNEYRIVTPSGGLRWIGAWGDTTYNERGEALRMTGLCIDITERKRVGNALRESEEEYRSLIQGIQVGVVVHAPDSSILFSNPRASELLGLTPEQMRGKTAIDETWRFIREDGTRMPLEEYPVNQALATHKPITNLILGILRPDRERPTWVQCNAHQDWDLNGNLQQVVVSFADITERKRAEEVLRERESLLNKIFDILPVGLWLADKNGNLTRSNHKGREIWGAEPLVGQEQYGVFKARRLPSGEQLAPDDWALAHTIREGVTITDELLEIEAFDGRKKIILNYTAPVLDQDGNVDGAVIVNLDITERMQAEDALRESEERFRRAVLGAPFPIMIHAEDGEVVTINTPWTELTGYEQSDIPTIAEWTQKAYGARMEQVRADIDSLYAMDGPKAEGEYTIMTRSGQARTWDFSSSPIGKLPDGRRLVISIAMDITERRLVREQLLMTLEELKRSNAELEQFAYVASHDLQEPLRAVAGMVQLLQQRYKDRLDERANEYIRLAVDGATRMQTLISDLLAYSRVQRRGNPIQTIDANDALTSAIRNLNTAITELGATVTNEELPMVEADATQLTQLFQNLIGNAVKFHGEHPPQVHIGVNKLEDAWQFSVSDNGIGIEAQYFERIFLVFQRLHTRRDYPGTGIGLSICRKIVERHGGRIWIESHPGQGSTFHFTIPFRSNP